MGHHHIGSYNKVSPIQCQVINTLRPGQNGRHFPDDIFKYILLNEIYEFKFHWNFS